VEGAAPPLVCASGVHRAKEDGHDVVILDTAGRLHVDEDLMREVGDIAREVKPDAQVLVVDAMTGQDAVRSAEAFHAELSLTGLILTKLDGDARGGAAVSLKAVTGCPILFVGTGEKVDDLDAFHPDRMAGRILGMGDVVGLVEKAQEEIGDKEAQDSYEKMVLGTFTLEDMLSQLKMMRRMGPMKKVLGMMPGVGNMAKDIDIDDKHMDHLEALFTSMTPTERLHPEVLDMSRRRRIGRGAGQEVGAVNGLLKRFKDMKKLMKQMGKLGTGAKMGSKAKKDALRGMSASGELADEGGGGLGAMLGGAAGGLGSLFGGGGGAGEMPSMGMNPQDSARPMGSSSTRKKPPKRKKKPKKSRKGRK
jgi:signal recognition particle subunit SRP54